MNLTGKQEKHRYMWNKNNGACAAMTYSGQYIDKSLTLVDCVAGMVCEASLDIFILFFCPENLFPLEPT